jgi:predicted DNA-binding protein
MDIFIGKHNCKLSTKVTTKVKDRISELCKEFEITESQFLRVAIEKQIKAAETLKTPQP